MRINIQYKITLIFSLIIAVILCGVFVYLHQNIKNQILHQIHTSLQHQTKLSNLYIQLNYPENQSVTLIDQLADRVANEIELRVTIIDTDGKVVGDSVLDPAEISQVDNHLYRPEIQEALKNGFGQSLRYSQTLKKKLLYQAIVLKHADSQDHLGYVRLAVPLNEVQVFTDSLKRLILISLGFAFLVSIIFGFLASNIISKPIKSVSSIAQGIATGDFSQRAEVYANDELSDLAVSVNNMSKQIKERIDEVNTSRMRLEAVLLSMFDGVIVVGTNGKIILMNKALRELLQITEEVVGKKPIEVIRNVEVQEIISRLLKNEGTVVSKEISLLFPEEKELIVHAAPVSMNNAIDGLVIVFHDVSDLKRLETIRKDFVANVSHELRTPITNIKGYAETLLEGALKDPENSEDFTRVIYTEAERLAKLVEDVLDLSRIESGKINFDFKPHDIQSLVDRVEKGLRKQIQKKGITFTKEIPDNLPTVLCDAPSIAQVLLNLIENAVKYNKDGGSITVRAKVVSDFMEISISDTGIGIPQDDIDRIFERFFRVDKAHSREIGGTGLGLSIVKHLIQSHQGELIVNSQIDLGSEFTFTLPIAAKNVT